MTRVLAAAALVLAGACGGAPAASPASEPGERRAVIVSGRDDHGLLAAPTVALLDEPDGSPTAAIADGTIVAVVASRHEWLRVATVGGPARREGWINDHHLRGTGFLPCAAGQVELLAARGDRVRVRPVAGGTARWVGRGDVTELPTDGCDDAGDPGAPAEPGHDHGDHGATGAVTVADAAG